MIEGRGEVEEADITGNLKGKQKTQDRSEETLHRIKVRVVWRESKVENEGRQWEGSEVERMTPVMKERLISVTII